MKREYPVKSVLPARLAILLGISALLRGLLAAFTELGNDEAYYWTYAAFPQLSYFDHPPMVGWLIRIFTFNLSLQHEFFVRLAAVVAGTVNTWLLYLVGKRLRDELTGWYAALLYTASLYGFIITGTFILPDAPQSVCWLAAMLLMLEVLPFKAEKRADSLKMTAVGALLGLGMLGKYSTVFLAAGLGAFVLFYNRAWLKRASLCLALLIAVLLFSPVIAWNAMNHFISFAFQGARVEVADGLFNYNTFLTELGGEILYQNPVNFILILLALIMVFSRRELLRDDRVKILLWSGLPIILLFLGISLFRGTLPHWSAPGYTTLIPLAALWVRTRKAEGNSLLPGWIAASLGLLAAIVLAGVVQVKTGIVKFDPPGSGIEKKGRNDISLEIYGWRKLGEEFGKLSSRYEKEGLILPGSPIVTYKWFPAAHLHYYVARPAHRQVMAAGPLADIHHYAWINRETGGFRLNTDAWYITSSRNYRPPQALQALYYSSVSAPDTFPVTRAGDTAYYFFIYRLNNLQAKPADPLKQ